MEYLFLAYPPCSTCRNARKWLDEQGVSYVERHIVDEAPTVSELKTWMARSGLPVRSFFNTSGLVYRSLQLKDKLSSMTEEEQIALLASDGKLVKRPLVVAEDRVLVGFRPDEWREKLL